jgi:dihydrofolate synthase/folylpolyglutamate synthase
MSQNNTLKKLFSLHQFGVKLGLDNIKNLLNRIGNPEKELKAIHIAGSNGKGSTASFMASILQESGFKTGLYTSPHYVEFNERIRINTAVIPDAYIVNFVEELWNYIIDNGMTFFEVTTALAFKYFAESNVEYAVIETGLGGRLDATNVLNPVASVITTISLEHTNILGESILSVAGEKAGIFKNDTDIYSGFLPESVKALYREKAAAGNNKIYFLDEVTHKGDDYLMLDLGERKLNLYQTPLKGDYQLVNCALAVLALVKTINGIEDNHIIGGINKVRENSGIQGRYETYSVYPRVIFDSAHNPEGIDAFLSEFTKERKNYHNSILIFGTMKDKKLDEAFLKLSRYFDTIYVTSINYERAFKKEELISMAEGLGIGVISLDRPDQFISDFVQKPSDDCLVILGSIYLLGDVKHKLSAKST